MIEYFRGHPCKLLTRTAIGVLISGLGKNQQYQYFLLYDAEQNMSSSLDVLRQYLNPYCMY